MKRTWVPLLILLLGGCYLPPFDADQSLSLLVTGKMESRGLFGPVSLTDNHGDHPLRMEFLPAKSTNPNLGLLTMTWPTRGVHFALSGFGKKTRMADSIREFDPVFVAGVLVAPYSHLDTAPPEDPLPRDQDVGVVYPGPHRDFSSRSFMISIPTSLDVFLYDNAPSGITSDSRLVLASSAQPQTVGFNDFAENFHNLFYDNIGDQVQWYRSGPSFALGGAYVLSSNLVSTFAASKNVVGMAVLDLSNIVFSTLDNGSYTTYKWTDTGNPSKLSAVKGKVVGALSTGDFLCEDDGWIRIYSSGGNLKWSFPAGTLRFAYEWENGGVKECIFTSVRYNPQYETVSAEVYAIRTSKLSDLNW